MRLSSGRAGDYHFSFSWPIQSYVGYLRIPSRTVDFLLGLFTIMRCTYLK